MRREEEASKEQLCLPQYQNFDLLNKGSTYSHVSGLRLGESRGEDDGMEARRSRSRRREASELTGPFQRFVHSLLKETVVRDGSAEASNACMVVSLTSHICLSSRWPF